MGGASSFLALLAICGFLSAAWLATRTSKVLGVSSIVLELFTGIVLGPKVVGLISEEYATCEFQRHAECVPPPDFLELLDQGLPVGRTLGRIVHLGYCERDGRGGLPIHHPPSATDDDAVANASEDNLSEDNLSGDNASDDNASDDNASEANDSEDNASEHNASEEAWAPTTTTEAPADAGAPTPHDTSAGSASTPRTTPRAAPPTTARARPLHPWEITGIDDEVEIVWPSPLVGQDDVEHRRALSARQVAEDDSGAEGWQDAEHPEGKWGAEDLEAFQAEDPEEEEEHPHAGPWRSSLVAGNFESYAACVESSCEADMRRECGRAPDIFSLIGHAGVALMLFESGMHFDFARAQGVASQAGAVALMGTLLPFVTGLLVMMAYGKPMLPDAFAVGTALAPTSVGIALRLLGEAGVVHHAFGQTIVTAAFLDDLLSLVLLNVLFNLSSGVSVLGTIFYPLICLALTGITMAAAVKFWPGAFAYVRSRLPAGQDGRKVPIEDELLFLTMMVLLVLYATATHFMGTHLWGCFIAGMSFACLDSADSRGRTHHVWVRQTKRLLSWMIRIFFACTVAFTIPVHTFFTWGSFWRGSIMGLFPCVAAKVLGALFMGKPRWVIGWAMVGRAELAYFVAQAAAAAGMMDEETFSIAIWALLYATVIAPFVFRAVLGRYIEKHGIEVLKQPKVFEVESDGEDEAEDATYAQETLEQRTLSGPRKGGRDFDIDAPRVSYGRKELRAVDGVVLNEVPEKGVATGLPVRGTDPYLPVKGPGSRRELGCSPPVARMMHDAVAEEGGEAGAAAPRPRGRFFFGRPAEQRRPAGDKNFLCCMFFKKMVVF